MRKTEKLEYFGNIFSSFKNTQYSQEAVLRVNDEIETVWQEGKYTAEKYIWKSLDGR